MKLKLLLSALLMTTLVCLQAQPTIKVGGTLADLKAPEQDLITIKPRSNIYLGLNYQIFINDAIGIEPGITYQKLTSEYSTPLADFNYTRSYVAIPLLVKFFPRSVFSFGGGVQAAFLAKDDFKDNFKNEKFTLSAQAQATINPIPQVGFEFGYNFGLTPYANFDSSEVGPLQFKNGDGTNRFYYATILLNLR